MSGPPAKVVRLSGTTFRLVTSKKRIRKASMELGSIKGFSDHPQAVIAVDSTYPTESQRNTLIHEVLHMALAEGGVYLAELLRDVGSDPEEVEERLVRGLTLPLLAFLRRNPELVEWLTTEDV